MMNYAVDVLKAIPNVSVYLDGTHSAWLGSGDAAHRLLQPASQRADGFFLNVSNYSPERAPRRIWQLGFKVHCLFATEPSILGQWTPDWCASPVLPGQPE